MRHQVIHNAIHKVLYLGIAEVKHQLITEVIFIAVGQRNDPVLVLLIQLALGIHHLGLNPNTKPDAFLFSCIYQSLYLTRQFVAGLFPIAQALCIAMTWVFVSEPAIIKQEHIYTQFHGIVHQTYQFILVEVEIRCLPVVEQRQTILRPIL